MDADDSEDAATREKSTEADRTSAESPAALKHGTGPGLPTGRYRIQQRLAKGGMGEVMIAIDDQIGRTVAIKRMRAAAPSERQISRFLREARIQGRLSHPAVCKVHEIGVDDSGAPFFAMERLEGVTLAAMLGSGLADTKLRVLRAFAEVCLAVELAHTRGIVHRDLKPENIMLGNFGEVFVIDWGVAKVIGEADGEFADIGSGEDHEHATAVGTMIGTPGYMAPEQIRGVADIDARADVYALGCVLFEILAGESVHPPGRAGLDSALAGGELRPSTRAASRDIPPELDELCAQALAADRDQRIASARELGDRVQRYLDGDRDLARRRDLARGHFERAQAAFAAGDQARSITMREAGRALALDPTSTAAAELVTRLMLEPPQTTPPDVELAILADNAAISRGNARFGMWAYLSFLAFSPLLAIIAPARFVVALVVLIAINAAVCWKQSRAKSPQPVAIVLTNAIMIALVSHMFSPFFIAPAIATLVSIMIVISQHLSRLVAGGVLVAVMSGAVLVPWLLEQLGVLAVTTTPTDHGLLLSAIGTTSGSTIMLALAAIYVVLLIAVACSFGDAMRSRERTAKRHVLMQAWQLKQLVAA